MCTDAGLRQAVRQRTSHSEVMLRLLGPVEVSAIAPFCSAADVSAWAATDRETKDMVDSDAVWRHILLWHLRPAVECLTGVSPSLATPECAIARLRDGLARKLYPLLLKISPEPFVLQQRARLMLEIHELAEWDNHQRSFVIQRQAKALAEEAGLGDAIGRLQKMIRVHALKLVSLQAMGSNRTPKLGKLEEVNWGPAEEQELSKLVADRLKVRLSWWQMQRDSLFQELNMH
mmetsp:Transcript_43619/g.102855  ORF Transcript_43619/g.102855 Transcript_43619/m.102855 type:complete len:232 (-) Transcript_43619:123-818(-)